MIVGFHNDDKMIWAGLNDKEVESTYVWIATGQNATYIHWSDTEPSPEITGEDCSIFFPSDRLLMADIACSGYGWTFKVLCEI